MNTTLKLVAVALTSLMGTEALKVGLISDIHLNLHYDASVDTGEHGKGDCIRGQGNTTSVHAPMGRYGCDSPTNMIESMI